MSGRQAERGDQVIADDPEGHEPARGQGGGHGIPKEDRRQPAPDHTGPPGRRWLLTRRSSQCRHRTTYDEQQPHRQCSGHREPRGRRPDRARRTGDRRHEQWAGEGTDLVEGLVYAEASPQPNLSRRVGQERALGG